MLRTGPFLSAAPFGKCLSLPLCGSLAQKQDLGGTPSGTHILTPHPPCCDERRLLPVFLSEAVQAAGMKRPQLLWSPPVGRSTAAGQASGVGAPHCPQSALCSSEQDAPLRPENSQKSRGEEGCKFLGCSTVKYFIEERHGKCVLLGKRPSAGASSGLQQHKYEFLSLFFP